MENQNQLMASLISLIQNIWTIATVLTDTRAITKSINDHLVKANKLSHIVKVLIKTAFLAQKNKEKFLLFVTQMHLLKAHINTAIKRNLPVSRPPVPTK